MFARLPAISAATAALLTVVSCSVFRSNHVASNGVEVRRVEAPTPARAVAAGDVATGDYVLTAPGLRAAVAGTARRGVAVGDVLYVRPDGARAAAQPLAPLLVAGGRTLALSEPAFETRLVRGQPTVRLTAVARAPAGATLRVARDYALSPVDDALVISTRVTYVADGRAAAAGPLRAVQLGARLPWQAHAPFAPGVGFAREARRARAPWIGRAAAGVAFGWTSLAGELELALRPTVHHDEAVSGETVALTPASRDLAPGRALDASAMLLVRRGDLTDLARAVAHVRGAPVHETPLRVFTVPTDPAEGLFAVIAGHDNAPVLVAELRPGVARNMPLAAGEYVAYVAAPGHTPADPVRFTVPRGEAASDVAVGTAAPSSTSRPDPIDVELPRGGRVRFRARDAETGSALPVRVVIRGVDGTPDPFLGPFNEAAGAGTLVVSPSGSGEFTVPPGRYELTFSHGPEWSIAQVRTEVTATMRGEASADLSHVAPMPDWTACDFHVHSGASFDSAVSNEDRVASLVVEGIEFATPTEHNAIGSYAAGVAELPPPAAAAGLGWVPAVEVTTDQAPTPSGHFNVFPYPPDLASEHGGPPPFLESPRQIFRAARARNPDAIIQVNHPRMGDIGYFQRARLDPLTNTTRSPLYDRTYDALEVFNGYYIGQPESVDAVVRDWFALLRSGARYVATASSDSHTIAYHQAGYPRTYVYTPGAGDHAPADPQVIIRALRAGHAFGTSGPMLLVRAGEQLPGDTVRTSAAELSLDVRVIAAPWVDVDQLEVWRDGQRVATVPVPPGAQPLRLAQTLSVPLTAARSFVVLIARGDRTLDEVLPNTGARAFAFTNPIWVERVPSAE